MRNIALKIAFDGSAYHGWQVQPNAVTVQQVLQDALETVLPERPPVTGCSRTDAGVHAREFYCNFRTQSGIPCENLRRALGALLPRDISVLGCREAAPGFHARYNAKGKEYLYYIDNGAVRDPFRTRYALYVPTALHCSHMRRAAAFLSGRHDFAAFCAAGSSVRGTVRTVATSEVRRHGDLIVFRVIADGFLYNMVRIMAGTLLEAGRGKLAPEAVPGILRSGRREEAGPTVPPQGLFLNRVFYDYENAPVSAKASVPGLPADR